MSEKRYCEKCGKEKIDKVLLRGFDPRTGERNFSMECPDYKTIDCVHQHDYHPAGFFRMADEKCTKCGDEVIYPCF